MKLNNAQIFLYMQIFFVVFGIILFFGLKALKDARAEKDAVVMQKAEPLEGSQLVINEDVDLPCEFDAWVGQEIDYSALNETGRPYRILPPGSMMTMDFNPKRINVHVDDHHTVLKIDCG